MEWAVVIGVVVFVGASVRMLWEVHRLGQWISEVDGTVEHTTRGVGEALGDHEARFHANQLKQFELQEQARVDEHGKALKAMRPELV